MAENNDIERLIRGLENQDEAALEKEFAELYGGETPGFAAGRWIFGRRRIARPKPMEPSGFADALARDGSDGHTIQSWFLGFSGLFGIKVL